MNVTKSLAIVSFFAALAALPKVVVAAEAPAVPPPTSSSEPLAPWCWIASWVSTLRQVEPTVLGGEYQAGFLRFSRGRTSAGGIDTALTTFQIAPSLDVFVSRRVTLGGELGFAYQRAESELGLSVGSAARERFSVTIFPRVGYYLPIID